jgi:hypothetical protein
MLRVAAPHPAPPQDDPAGDALASGPPRRDSGRRRSHGTRGRSVVRHVRRSVARGDVAPLPAPCGAGRAGSRRHGGPAPVLCAVGRRPRGPRVRRVHVRLPGRGRQPTTLARRLRGVDAGLGAPRPGRRLRPRGGRSAGATGLVRGALVRRPGAGAAGGRRASRGRLHRGCGVGLARLPARVAQAGVVGGLVRGGPVLAVDAGVRTRPRRARGRPARRGGRRVVHLVPFARLPARPRAGRPCASVLQNTRVSAAYDRRRERRGGRRPRGALPESRRRG